jgi:hypothetical protein
VKEQSMRKLITTVAAALALAGVGLATHHATSNTPAEAMIIADYSDRMTGPSGGFYLMNGEVVEAPASTR